MPGGDRRGPLGLGPRTGRAAGYCAGYPVPGFMNPISGPGLWGRGWGGGRGWRGGGRGHRNWFYATGLPGWARSGYGYPALGGSVLGYSPAAPAPYAASSPEQELEALRSQAEHLDRALDAVRQRIGKLEAESKSE